MRRELKGLTWVWVEKGKGTGRAMLGLCLTVFGSCPVLQPQPCYNRVQPDAKGVKKSGESKCYVCGFLSPTAQQSSCSQLLY